MTLNLPTDLRDFVADEISSGAYCTADEIVGDALRLFRDMKARHAQLVADVQIGIEEADKGLAQPISMDALIERCTRMLSEEGIPD
jgi:putative addiction module CopG family antidote